MTYVVFCQRGYCAVCCSYSDCNSWASTYSTELSPFDYHVFNHPRKLLKESDYQKLVFFGQPLKDGFTLIPGRSSFKVLKISWTARTLISSFTATMYSPYVPKILLFNLYTLHTNIIKSFVEPRTV